MRSNCEVCGTPFKTSPSRHRRFCSPACWYQQAQIPLPERFWKHVEKTDDCWLWTATKSRFGYGSISVRPGMPRPAHRVSWQLANGLIPDGLNVLHHCDNPSCVRPDHLFLGTFKDNTNDMVRKGRHGSQRHPDRLPRGEANHAAKLVAADVAAIRTRYAGGEIKAALARDFGISSTHVARLIRGEWWKHVPPEAMNVTG